MMRKAKLTKVNLKRIIRNSVLVVIGTFIVALGTELFILPAGLDTGGVSGIAMCFKYAGVEVESEHIITIVSWGLFALGLIFLGWNFSAQTLLSTAVYTVSLYLIKWITTKWTFLLIENSASMAGHEPLVILLSAIFGGVLVGTGCAITFMGGGSTGGVDVLTFIIVKYFKKVKSSYCIFAIDATIVVLGFMFNKTHDIALCLEGVVSAFFASLVIDRIFTSTFKIFVANIVTDKYDEITNDIITKIDRTTTILDVVGGYSKDNKKMIMVSFSMMNYKELINVVYNNDKKAFMTINRAYEIKGEGFAPLVSNKK